MNKVNYYQSGCIIGIVRDKNGFIDYIRDGPQYSDIKLNVLIRGKHNNIIGEVQFLLNVMKDFKDKAHNLYSIQRKKESIESSVSEILPLLLDQKTRLLTAAINGNVSELCKLMVVSNLKPNDIMAVDPKTKKTILNFICIKNNLKVFSFIQSIISSEELIEHLFRPSDSNQRSIELC